MTLNDIKIKRLSESTKSTKGKRKNSVKKLRKLASGSQAYVDVAEDEDEDEDDLVSEAEVRTPKFVQHCVSAITSDSAKLKKVEQKGSPFAICNAQYNSNKASLASRHSQGRHHSVKDYKNALTKLREAVEAHSESNVDPRCVSFTPLVGEQEVNLRSVRFAPGT